MLLSAAVECAQPRGKANRLALFLIILHRSVAHAQREGGVRITGRSANQPHGVEEFGRTLTLQLGGFFKNSPYAPRRRVHHQRQLNHRVAAGPHGGHAAFGQLAAEGDIRQPRALDKSERLGAGVVSVQDRFHQLIIGSERFHQQGERFAQLRRLQILIDRRGRKKNLLQAGNVFFAVLGKPFGVRQFPFLCQADQHSGQLE